MTKDALRQHLQPTLEGATFPGHEHDHLTRFIAQSIDNAKTLQDVEDDLNYALANIRRTKDAVVAIQAQVDPDAPLQ